jgi:hypothetical protein
MKRTIISSSASKRTIISSAAAGRSRVTSADELNVNDLRIDTSFSESSGQRLITSRALSSPDYTFIAKHLRAIVKGTDVDGHAPDDDVVPYVFTADDLRRLILHKKKTRMIDAHVLVGGFDAFLQQLHDERRLNLGVFPRRIQVAYQRDGLDTDGLPFEHWTALDILLTQEQMHIFYLDSAGDDRNLNIIIEDSMKYAQTELTLCEDIELDGKSFALQKDGESCSIFTIDHVFHMSKLHDLHDHVVSYRTPDAITSHTHIYSLDPRRLPAMLVRNAQSESFLREWFSKSAREFTKPVDKKEHNIIEYTKLHGVFYPPARKNINAGIQRKQLKYAARLAQEDSQEFQVLDPLPAKLR